MANTGTILQTTTIVNSDFPDIEILTFYDGDQDELPNTISAELADINKVNNSVSIDKGDLFIVMKNSPTNIDYYINSNGELVVLTPIAEDADNYTIDSDGNLIYSDN